MKITNIVNLTSGFEKGNTSTNPFGLFMRIQIFFLLTLLTPAFCIAQVEGDLDSTFSNDGIQTTSISWGDDQAYALAIQPDGKIVAAGNSSFAVVRYNNDGSLDINFSAGGIQTDNIGTGNNAGKAMAIQADGKIIVAGWGQGSSFTNFALIRYNSNGSLDTTFSGDGKQLTNIGDSNNQAFAVAIQSDGKILVGGFARFLGNDDFALTRYNSDGSLDSTFNVDGIQTTAFGTGHEYVNSIAIQADGKIVAGGYIRSLIATYDFALARYNTDGSLDSTFSGDGKLIKNLDIYEHFSSVAIQSDGKIILAGKTGNAGESYFVLMRYNSDGSIDNSFNGNGVILTDFGTPHNLYCNSVAIQNDGKIIAVGTANTPSFTHEFAIARYNIDGSLDNAFSQDGKQTTEIGSGEDIASAVAIQADGKIVVAGYTHGTFKMILQW